MTVPAGQGHPPLLASELWMEQVLPGTEGPCPPRLSQEESASNISGGAGDSPDQERVAGHIGGSVWNQRPIISLPRGRAGPSGRVSPKRGAAFGWM